MHHQCSISKIWTLFCMSSVTKGANASSVFHQQNLARKREAILTPDGRLKMLTLQKTFWFVKSICKVVGNETVQDLGPLYTHIQSCIYICLYIIICAGYFYLFLIYKNIIITRVLNHNLRYVLLIYSLYIYIYIHHIKLALYKSLNCFPFYACRNI